MAITGVMRQWTDVLLAPADQAPHLLQAAALGVLQPGALTVTLLAGALLASLCRRFWQHPDPAWRLAAGPILAWHRVVWDKVFPVGIFQHGGWIKTTIF